MADSKDAPKGMQKAVDEAQDKGLLGVEVDPTPNEEYSLEKPDSWNVPEADPKAAARASKVLSGNRLGAEEA